MSTWAALRQQATISGCAVTRADRLHVETEPSGGTAAKGTQRIPNRFDGNTMAMPNTLTRPAAARRVRALGCRLFAAPTEGARLPLLGRLSSPSLRPPRSRPPTTLQPSGGIGRVAVLEASSVRPSFALSTRIAPGLRGVG